MPAPFINSYLPAFNSMEHCITYIERTRLGDRIGERTWRLMTPLGARQQDAHDVMSYLMNESDLVVSAEGIEITLLDKDRAIPPDSP